MARQARPKKNLSDCGYDSDKQIWEKQTNETNISYKAFIEYLDMGTNGGKRSLRGLAASGRTGSDINNLEMWSSINKWQERAAAYDLHILEEKQKELRLRQEKTFDRIGQHSLLLYKMAQEMMKSANSKEMSFKDAKEYLRLAVELDMIANHVTPQDIDREAKQRQRVQDMELATASGSLADVIIASYKGNEEGE